MIKKEKKIVWLEDHFKNFEEIIRILERLGLTVKKVGTQEEFEAAVEDGFECGILDNKIGDRHSVGQRLIERLAATSTARLLMFTAYLPKQKSDQSFEETLGGGHAGYLSKRFSDFDTVRAFWEHSAQTIYKFFTSEDPANEVWEEKAAENAFSEFENLSLSQQGDRFRNAADANKELLEGLWADGAIAVILPGGSREGYQAYFSREELPEWDDVLADYESKGIYPYMYSNEYSFDDTNCHAVHREGTVRTYPRIVIGMDGPQSSFHFDTGADTSIFCESYLNEVGGARVTNKKPFPLNLHGKSHAAVKVVLTTFIHNETVNGFPRSEPVEIPGLMVDSWHTARLQVLCSSNCSNSNDDNPGCIYRRNGLIGRDVYTQNDLQILLSFEDPQIAARRRKS